MRTKGMAVAGTILLLTLGAGSNLQADPAHDVMDAARDGDAARLKALLKVDPNLVRAVDFFPYYTPLHWAADHGRKEAAELLLASGAEVDSTSDDGTPLYLAVWNGHQDVAELLLSKGAKLDVFTAAGLGKIDELKRFLKEAGSSVAAEDALQGKTPLHWAAAGGQKAAAELLLDKGAKPSARTIWDDTPLHYAAAFGRNTLVKLLLDHDVDLNVQNSSGRTPLHDAVFSDNLEGAELLIAQGADVNARQSRQHPINAFGNYISYDTPLHVAVRYGKQDMIELLASKADLEIRNAGGSTPLHEAAAVGKIDAVRTLLKFHANVDDRDDHDRTPLHEAAASGDKALVELLLVHKADANAQDEDGHPPLDYVRGPAKDAVAELLRKRMGKDEDQGSRGK